MAARKQRGTHVVDEAVLVPDAELLKLGLVLRVIDLLEDVLPLAVVALQDGVLGRQVLRAVASVRVSKLDASARDSRAREVRRTSGSFFSMASLNDDWAKSVMDCLVLYMARPTPGPLKWNTSRLVACLALSSGV